MFDWLQGFENWLQQQVDYIVQSINPLTWVLGVLNYVSSLLPDPNPQLRVIVDMAVSAVDGLVGWISLFDFFVNLPVLLVILGIMLAVEVVLLAVRAWRLVRSFVI
jgi:hypothetical protein